ncbi:hypothetical protein GCM10009836_55990 [Pseudonocardia ailaonensis]|uniref:Uncharacterized protein n=1 Tax=Pseudonocardia ailaonensis TaxID=367279 RepID=A0ABN2NGQ8_9PSEU
MSTPSDPSDQPRYDPYSGGPSSGQYAQYPQNPYGSGSSGNPYGYQQPQPYAYSPYGQQPSPGAFDPEPEVVPRPGAMVGALILLVLSALPFLVFGVLGLFVPITQSQFPTELGLDALLTQYNVTFDQFLQAVRLIVALVAVLALVYILFAALAFGGRNWARIASTVLTVIFAVFLLLNIAGAGVASALVLAPVVLSVLGVVLMFVRPSARWFASRR